MSKIFEKFVEKHGNDWIDITPMLGNIEGLIIAVATANNGIPLTVHDVRKNTTYFPYVKCYMIPTLRLNIFKRNSLTLLVKSKFPRETNVNVLYKDPLA